MFLFANYPSWIHPEIFPGVPVLGLLRWYGLMYIFAFGTAYMVLKQTMKNACRDLRGNIPAPKFVVSPFLNSSIEPDVATVGFCNSSPYN